MPLVRKATSEARLDRQRSEAALQRAATVVGTSFEAVKEEVVSAKPSLGRSQTNPTMASPRHSPHQSPYYQPRPRMASPSPMDLNSPRPHGTPPPGSSPGRRPSLAVGDVVTYGPPQLPGRSPPPPIGPPLPSSYSAPHAPNLGRSSNPSAPPVPGNPPLVLPLPTFDQLAAQHPQLPTMPTDARLTYITSLIRHLDRHLKQNNIPTCPPHLQPLLSTAIPLLLEYLKSPDPLLRGQASYIVGHLLSTGSCPRELPKDPRQAFKDFEVAAKAGVHKAWFRLGRDYEACGEEKRARDCFERGVKRGDGECMYRMGMAHLMGQLGLPPNFYTAMPILRTAASRATIDAPQSCYVLGMLFAGEFEFASLPPNNLLPPTSPPSDLLARQHSEARSHILNAAYLCFSPAQYKAGYMHEHATLGAAYDPLLSVQFYSLASQNGEVEADMALSKWFLVGGEGQFEKNEALARTFAQKAARAGLGSGCFALGYYYELGIGGRMDADQSRAWYHKAAEKGNKEAIARLQALATGPGSTLSVQQHEATLNNTLVRSRTAAKMRSTQGTQGHGRRGSLAEMGARAEAEELARRASQIQITPGRYGSPSVSPRQAPQQYQQGHDRLLSADGLMLPPPAQNGYSTSNSIQSLPTSSSRPTSPGPRSRESSPMPRRGGINNGDSRPHSSPSLEPSHHQRTSVSLQDPGVIARTDDWQPGPDRSTKPEQAAKPQQPQQPAAQTFAEMGFVSKATKDDDCVIM